MAFANRWGWTPDQVDELPAELYHRLIPVAKVIDEVRAAAQKRAAAQNT